MIGYDRIVKISKKNVNTIIKWSTQPFSGSDVYDRKLVHAVLLLSTNTEELALEKIDGDVLEFIERVFIKKYYT